MNIGKYGGSKLILTSLDMAQCVQHNGVCFVELTDISFQHFSNPPE